MDSTTSAPSVVFLFPGQGSQYVGMGRALYERDDLFRAAIDDAAASLAPVLGDDLRAVLYPEGGASDAAAERLRQTEWTQTALFVVELALAEQWLRWGVEPVALVGHSLGEFVAATLAGVFSREDALRLVALRGRLMQQQPPGTMITVRAPADTLRRRLSGQLAVASDNAPNLSVLSGPADEVEALSQQLTTERIACRPLHTSHAFHSAMMEPVLGPLGEAIDKTRLSRPKRPIVSTATGTWLTDAEATSPGYWTSHLRKTVLYGPAARTLLATPGRIYVEVGPRNTLVTLLRQQSAEAKQATAVPSLGDTAVDGVEVTALLAAAEALAAQGVAIELAAVRRTLGIG